MCHSDSKFGQPQVKPVQHDLSDEGVVRHHHGHAAEQGLPVWVEVMQSCERRPAQVLLYTQRGAQRGMLRLLWLRRHLLHTF